MDDSGSMYGTWGDPTGVRYAAARSVLEFLRRCGAGQLGVIHWGSTAPEELALPPTDVRKGRGQILKALRIPPTLGGNNLGAALRLAAKWSCTLTVVITDGMEDFSLDLRRPIGALPEASIHVLLIDRSRGCGPEFEAQWRSLPLGSFVRLDDSDVLRMAHQIAELICRAVGARMPSLPTKPVHRRGEAR